MKAMVIIEQCHQHNLDKDYLQYDFKLKGRGQVFAFILSLVAF